MEHVLVPCLACQEEQGGDTTPSRTIVSGEPVGENARGFEFNLVLSCGHDANMTVSADERVSILSALGYNVDDLKEAE
jgi:hypothetical protein